jgi:hypothetical protein
MGFPASGIEAAWRNHIDEVCVCFLNLHPLLKCVNFQVASMLDKYHGFENTLIFNLSDRKYNYEKFKNQIVEVGFPDHYSPPLHVLFHIVLQINRWITADPKHVAVVHCMVTISLLIFILFFLVFHHFVSLLYVASAHVNYI